MFSVWSLSYIQQSQRIKFWGIIVNIDNIFFVLADEFLLSRRQHVSLARDHSEDLIYVLRSQLVVHNSIMKYWMECFFSNLRNKRTSWFIPVTRNRKVVWKYGGFFENQTIIDSILHYRAAKYEQTKRPGY